MPAITEKVEIGFDLTWSGAPFFTLDDATKGVLDNTSYPLGGPQFTDVTSRVLSYTIGRGKSRELDRYQVGQASITFNNNDRAFDPTFTASPFYGQIVPRKEVRISANGVVQYQGLIDDWNLTYAPGGNQSFAEATAVDGFSVLSKVTLTPGTETAQLSGARVNAILDDPLVGWPSGQRDIASGSMTLGADTIPADTNALTYLQTVELSEPGDLFMSKTNQVKFKGRNDYATGSAPTIADDGSGIPYTAIRVVYGSELLFNTVVISNAFGSTATASDASSVATYGVATLSETGLLVESSTDLANLAKFLVGDYAQPEFRFDSMDFYLPNLTLTQQNTLLALELGDSVVIKFTPNGIAPAITKYATVIKIAHSADSINHVLTLGFATLDGSILVLDSSLFGILDVNTLAF